MLEDREVGVPARASSVGEVALLFLKLGTIAFGGPAAHIAMMRDEVVVRRRWLSDQEFLDLLGATNLIPGPNSTEMAIHIGHRRAGWPGLIAGGACFILPALLIVLVIAALYVTYGSTPQAEWLLYGIKPVIIAVVVQALWGLGRTAVKSWLTGAVGVIVTALALLGVNELALLFAGGLLVMLLGGATRLSGSMAAIALPGAAPVLALAAQAPAAFSLLQLFLIFLKIGSVLYGSGYVLLAFLRSDLVVRLGWLTDQQLLDAVAIGQFTPGPVFTTATFIGYVLGAPSGQALPAALLATIGIFLPAFVFVALSAPLVPRLRRSPRIAALLDGVNVASLGLMAAVSWQIARAAVVDPLTGALALLAFVALVQSRVNSAWLVLAGGAIGFVYRFIGG